MTSLRGIIIALIILGIGVYAIRYIGENFLKQANMPAGISQFGDLIKSFHGLIDTVLIGIGVLVVLLIIVAIAKRKPKPKLTAIAPQQLPRAITA